MNDVCPAVTGLSQCPTWQRDGAHRCKHKPSHIASPLLDPHRCRCGYQWTCVVGVAELARLFDPPAAS